LAAAVTARSSGGRASQRRAGALSDAQVTGPGRPERDAAARADRARDQAYRQGQAAARRRVDETRGPGRTLRRHRPAQVHPDPEHQSLYEQGFTDAIRTARRAGVRASAPVRRGGELVDDGAGFILGLLAYALFLAYARGGWDGVKAWTAAKFLNKTASQRIAPQGGGGGKQAPAPSDRPYDPGFPWRRELL
jgi:hypothetical protein